MTCTKLLRQLRSRLSEDGEVPGQSVSLHPVVLEIATNRDSVNEGNDAGYRLPHLPQVEISGRGIKRLRVCKDLITDQRVQGPPRHQVDRAPEQGGKILRQVLDLPTERSSLGKFVEKIDIASWTGFTTSDRPEDIETCDPETTAQRVQSRSVDV